MNRILKEMAVVVATYEDRNTGQQKNRYRNIGVMMEAEKDGQRFQYLLLDKTFNPAGVLTKPGSDKVYVSLFEPRDRTGSDQGQGEYNRVTDGTVNNDEIPF